MGLLDKLENFLGAKRKDANLLVIGLDNSGKSTIINFLKSKESKSNNVPATIGYNVEKFIYQSLTFTVNDMSGQSRYRSLWDHHYKDAHAILFVVDSSDRMRLIVSKEELFAMLNHPEIRNKNIPILVFANKIDENKAMNIPELRNQLELSSINKSWQIFGTNGLNGDGINTGIEWLVQELRKD